MQNEITQLAAARKAAQMTYIDLEADTGVSATMARYLLQGRHTKQIKSITAIADALGFEFKLVKKGE